MAAARDEQRGERADGEHRGADRQRGGHAVDVVLRREIAAGAEKTLARTAMPITPPSSRIVFVAPEAWPASSGARR